MNSQWSFVAGIGVTILVALFAFLNMEKVRVNYLFGEAEWPLIFIILGSALVGSLVTGLLGVKKTRSDRKAETIKKERISDSEKEH